MRLLLAALAVAAVLMLGGLVATAAPHAVVPTGTAAQAEYCPSGEFRRRFLALKRFTRQMARQRARYFRQTRNPRLRAAFVRKQNAQQKALLRALLRCD